jgi:hypothetical protein
MMKDEFLKRLHAIPGHESDEVTTDEYTCIEYVYMFHPAIPDVGGKDVIAHLYAYGGMLVIKDMYARAEKADDAEQKIAEIRRDIAGAEKRIAEIMAEVCA